MYAERNRLVRKTLQDLSNYDEKQEKCLTCFHLTDVNKSEPSAVGNLPLKQHTDTK